MARLVRTTKTQTMSCDIITKFADGTTSTKRLNIGDVVANLRYVKDEDVYSVSGRISDVIPKCTFVTPIATSKPVDHFTEDVSISTITIDASEQYQSSIVDIVAREIVEDSGTDSVVKVDVVAVPNITLEMTYTDGTSATHDISVGDVICNAEIMTSPGEPDLTGDFRVTAFKYVVANKQPVIYGIYITSLTTGQTSYAAFSNIIRFEEKKSAYVTKTDSLSEIAKALTEEDEVFAFLDNDVTIAKRSDGKITTCMVNAGKSLTVDLGGHTLATEAYAFYVNGGTLTIRDTSGTGKITADKINNAFPVVFVASDGVCNMESGTIDTTGIELEEDQHNWLYGVACSGNGIFNMTGGQMIIGGAAGISITNGTASGEGAIFNITGDAKIKATTCTAVYLADNKSVNISGNAVIDGGIMMRMGDLTVSDTASIISPKADADIFPLGKLVCQSGCSNHTAAILALTGCYGSSLGNDLNIEIKGTASVQSYAGNGIDIATLNTKYDQTAAVNVRAARSIKYANSLWNVYSHDELAELATAQGKTLPAEATTTNLTIKVEGEQVYPVAE